MPIQRPQHAQPSHCVSQITVEAPTFPYILGAWRQVIVAYELGFPRQEPFLEPSGALGISFFLSRVSLSSLIASKLVGRVGLKGNFCVKISERSIDIYDGTLLAACMVAIWGSLAWILLGVLIGR
jgi:hypothetical protein